MEKAVTENGETMVNDSNKGGKAMDISYIITGSGNINMVMDGESYIVDSTHKNYQKIMAALVAEDYVSLPELMDIAKAITVATDGEITVVDGAVLYKGKEVINPLTDRILSIMDEGMPFKPLMRFMGNLMKNPSSTSIQELYLFLEANTLPITPDGCFLAYKRVDEDYKDCYTHTIDNSIGAKIPRLERNEVDDRRDQLCSFGYHFCSLSYLRGSGFGGNGPIVLVKVNPADVVSIPSDYNNQKGRCCFYEVVADHKGTAHDEAFDKSVHNGDGSDYNPDEDGVDEDNEYCPECGAEWDGYECDDCGYDPYNTDEGEGDYNPYVDGNTHGMKPNGSRFHNVRDSKGRFVKK